MSYGTQLEIIKCKQALNCIDCWVLTNALLSWQTIYQDSIVIITIKTLLTTNLTWRRSVTVDPQRDAFLYYNYFVSFNVDCNMAFQIAMYTHVYVFTQWTKGFTSHHKHIGYTLWSIERFDGKFKSIFLSML